MSDLEIFTSLIAAIIHDFDHTGTTNNFHINSGSGLALLYNDRAVLENHHVSAFFRYVIWQNSLAFKLALRFTKSLSMRNKFDSIILHQDDAKTWLQYFQQHAEDWFPWISQFNHWNGFAYRYEPTFFAIESHKIHDSTKQWRIEVRTPIY